MYALSKILPPKPVRIGDTWPARMEVAAGPVGTLVLTTDYTFKGWEDHANRKMALLSYTGTISIKPGTATSNLGEVSMESARMIGRSWYDPAAGIVVDGDAEQEMVIKLSPGGQAVTSKIKQEISHRLLETQPMKK